MKINKYLLSISLLLVGAITSQGQSIKADAIAAVVGKEIILESDIEGAFAQFKMQGMELQESDKCKILEQLLVEKLLAHQAEVDSLPLSDSEISSSVNQRMQQLEQQVGSMKAVLDLYQKVDQESLISDLTDIIRVQMLAERMKKKIIGELDPSPDEVRRFFNKIPKDSLPEFDTEFELATIVINPTPDPKSTEEVVAKLKEMKKEIEAGDGFNLKAILYSEDPGSAPKGGLYEGVRKGQFVKPFEAVAFNLEEGEISDPVETEYGYHIIQVVKRRGETLDLRHILLRPKFMPDDLAKAEEKMDSIVSKIRSKDLEFNQAVKLFSQDDATKYNNGNMMNQSTGEVAFPITGLDRNMYYAVSHLKQGDVSEPVFIEDSRGGGKYTVFYVRKRIEPHKANFSIDYDKLKKLTKSENETKKIQDWVNKKSKDVYVKLGSEWDDCDFAATWGKTVRKK